MNITCPNCNFTFKETEAVIRPRKEKYKWYDFSSNVTLCPECNEIYVSDINLKGLLLVFSVFGFIMFLVNSEYNIAAILVVVTYVVIAKKLKHYFVSVKGQTKNGKST